MCWWSSLITVGRDGLRIQRAFAAPSAIAPTSRAVALSTATVDAVEALAVTIASRHRHRPRRHAAA
ncbi:hypothetical protein [Streptomyces sp. NPDC001315]|uniref:hypothetical protein n=1 Tax=Streptomyces sp. NPDC001315 TaxID=3364562 RepID=UPI00368C4106